MKSEECFSLFSLLFYLRFRGGGDDGIRTHDPLLAGQVLSQLSYTPIFLGSCFLLLKDPSKLNNESN